MSVRLVNTKSAVILEAIKHHAADRLCYVAISICVRFGHKVVFVYDAPNDESEATWYDMDYSDFDIVRDICSLAFDVVNVDASVPDIDGYNTYWIYGIESEVQV